MKSWTQQVPVAPLPKRVVALLFLLLFLGVYAISASHSLHQLVHHDAGAANHECVFVQVSSGHFLDTAQPVVLLEPLGTIAELHSVSVFIFASRDCPLLPGRAPPLSPA